MSLINTKTIYGDPYAPTFYRDFASSQNLNAGIGPAISFTRSSSATYVNSRGYIQTVTTNIPRFDYDPITLQCKGLLIEESRTNLLTASNNFNVWGYSGNGIVGTDASIISPAGDYNSYYLYDVNPVNAYPQVTYRNVAVTSNTDYTFSIYAKAKEWNLLVTQAYYSNNTVYLSGQNNSLTNNWNRYTFKFNTAAATDITFRCLLSGAASTWTGTSGINIWGAQFEQGSFATSYIPTSASTVIRANDIATVTPISGFYNQAEGSVMYEVNRPIVVLSAPIAKWGDPLSFYKSTDTTNYYIDFYNQIQVTSSTFSGLGGASIKILDGGINQAETGTSNNNVSYGLYKFTAGFKANDIVTFGNNTTGFIDTSATIPSGIDSLAIGCWRGGSNFYNGWIRKIAYYPSRLPNSTLLYLTK